MKNLIQKAIRRSNASFSFDPVLGNVALCSFIWTQCWGLMRGLKLLFLFKNPKMAMLGKGVSFFNTPKITFGRFLKLGNHVQIRAVIDEELEQVWAGRKSAKEALDAIVQRGNQQLERFQQTAGR
jgi:hypothetical protein